MIPSSGFIQNEGEDDRRLRVRFIERSMSFPRISHKTYEVLLKSGSRRDDG